MKSKNKILLVEPHFPLPSKSKNYSNFLPIGLLKLASYYRSKKYDIQLLRGNIDKKEIRFKPDKIMVTSLFTYWSKYVRNCVQYYKSLYPHANVTVGGIYASLLPEHCKEYTDADEVFIGIHEAAEKFPPAYDLVQDPEPLNYQIIHASRGCFRKCPFCGTWKIEPKISFKKSIKDDICSNKIIFYDNNILKNPYIKDILKELAITKYNHKPIVCESQCGFDGRLLTPELAQLIKKARFLYPRIAWDWKYSEYKEIKRQIKILLDAGYDKKDVYVFMLQNWDIPFKEMEKKRVKCWEWGVQIADCRFRPLTQTFDNYNSKKDQTNSDYYINPNWTDKKVKQFRKNIRRQNICIRQGLNFYSKKLEHKHYNENDKEKLRSQSKIMIKKQLDDAWFPEQDQIPISKTN